MMRAVLALLGAALVCGIGPAAAQNRFPLPPEPPARIPGATTLPSYRDQQAMPDPGDAPVKKGAPRIIPNGNGTSTVLEPDGSVRIIPTPR